MIGSRLLDNAADIRNRHGGMQRRYIQRAELHEMSHLRERLNLLESVAAAMASRMSQTYLMVSDLCGKAANCHALLRADMTGTEYDIVITAKRHALLDFVLQVPVLHPEASSNPHPSGYEYGEYIFPWIR